MACPPYQTMAYPPYQPIKAYHYIEIEVNAGNNMVGHFLGRGKKGFDPLEIKEQRVNGNTVTIYFKIVPNFRRCQIYVNNMYSRLEKQLAKIHKRTCKNKKYDKSKEENRYTLKKQDVFNYTYEIHGHHVPFVIGKGGRFLKHLETKYNCTLVFKKGKKKTDRTKLFISSHYIINIKNLISDIKSKILNFAMIKKPRDLTHYTSSSIFNSKNYFKKAKQAATSKISDWGSRCLHNPHTRIGKAFVKNRYFDSDEYGE